MITSAKIYHVTDSYHVISGHFCLQSTCVFERKNVIFWKIYSEFDKGQVSRCIIWFVIKWYKQKKIIPANFHYTGVSVINSKIIPRFVAGRNVQNQHVRIVPLIKRLIKQIYHKHHSD